MFLQWSGRAAGAIAAVLMCLAAAHAQDASAQMRWFGVYTVSDSRSVEDPRSPTGVRVIQTPIAPSSNTDRIPGRDDVRFGMSFVLSGPPGQQVTIRRVYRFPGDGMPSSSTGTKMMTYEDTPAFRTGEEVLMGWSFLGAPPERILIGEWALEVWVAKQKIISKRFTVYQP